MFYFSGTIRKCLWEDGNKDLYLVVLKMRPNRPIFKIGHSESTLEIGTFGIILCARTKNFRLKFRFSIKNFEFFGTNFDFDQKFQL